MDDRLICVPGHNPFEILAIGTSLTAGQSWPAKLGEALALQTGRGVSVQVCALAGGSCRFFSSADVNPARFHAVIVELATNDADWRSAVSLSRSAATLRSILSAAPAAIVVGMPDPVGVRAWFLRPLLGAYQRCAAVEAQRAGAGYADLRDRVRLLGAAERRRFVPDGLHPQSELLSRWVVPATAHLLAQVCP